MSFFGLDFLMIAIAAKNARGPQMKRAAPKGGPQIKSCVSDYLAAEAFGAALTVALTGTVTTGFTSLFV